VKNIFASDWERSHHRHDGSRSIIAGHRRIGRQKSPPALIPLRTPPKSSPGEFRFFDSRRQNHFTVYGDLHPRGEYDWAPLLDETDTCLPRANGGRFVQLIEFAEPGLLQRQQHTSEEGYRSTLRKRGLTSSS
jgi:hypothetical protein